MSKTEPTAWTTALTKAGTKSLQDHYKALSRTGLQALVHAYRIGELLEAEKQKRKRGEWADYVEALPFSAAMERRYRQFTRLVREAGPETATQVAEEGGFSIIGMINALSPKHPDQPMKGKTAPTLARSESAPQVTGDATPDDTEAPGETPPADPTRDALAQLKADRKAVGDKVAPPDWASVFDKLSDTELEQCQTILAGIIANRKGKAA